MTPVDNLYVFRTSEIDVGIGRPIAKVLTLTVGILPEEGLRMGAMGRRTSCTWGRFNPLRNCGGPVRERIYLRLVPGVLSGNPSFDQVLVPYCLLEQILGLGVGCDLGIVVVDHVSLAPAGFKIIRERPSG